MEMQGSLKGALDCIKEFSELTSLQDLKRIYLPTLMLRADDDHIVPIGAALLSSKIVARRGFFRS